MYFWFNLYFMFSSCAYLYIVYIADCVVHDMHIYKCFSLYMFFQAFKNEITALPEPLIDSLKFVPKLLTESKSSGTINNYYHGFLRWKKWAQTNGIKKDDILPAKNLHVLYTSHL